MLYEIFGRMITFIEFPSTLAHRSTKIVGLRKETIYKINWLADGVIVGGKNLNENNEIKKTQIMSYFVD